MPEILVQWGDILKLVSYELEDSVEGFRNNFFYSFEDHLLYPELFQARGYIQKNGVTMMASMSMGNYSLRDDDILTYVDAPNDRVDIRMEIRGQPKLFILHFDSSTSVEDLKRSLISKAKLHVPISQIMLSMNGTELSENNFTLTNYGVSPSSLLYAKEIPQVVYCDIGRDILFIKFNGKSRLQLIDRYPTENISIAISCRDLGESPESLTMTLYEANNRETHISMNELSRVKDSQDLVVELSLVESLKYDTTYVLQFHSTHSKYVNGKDLYDFEFKTRRLYGNLCFHWVGFLEWKESPRPDQIPIVHSFMHCLRKMLASHHWSGEEVVAKLQEVNGFRVTFTNGIQEDAASVDYLVEDAMQEELDLSSYEDGYDIKVFILVNKSKPLVEEPVVDEPVEDLNGELIYETTEALSVPIAQESEEIFPTTAAQAAVEEVVSTDQEQLSVEPILDINPIPEAHESATCISTENDVLESIVEETEQDLAPELVEPEVVMESLTALIESGATIHETSSECHGSDMRSSIDEIVVDTETSFHQSEGEQNPVVESDITVNGVDSDDEDETEEVRSVHEDEAAAASVSPNRQASDGTDSMIEFIDDGFLVLMPLDPMDTSIMVAEDDQSADIVVNNE